MDRRKFGSVLRGVWAFGHLGTFLVFSVFLPFLSSPLQRDKKNSGSYYVDPICEIPPGRGGMVRGPTILLSSISLSPRESGLK